MEKWHELIRLNEKYDGHEMFVAECIYAYLATFGDKDDLPFMDEPVDYINSFVKEE
ncbi:hypothetical protein NCCP28_05710 [Niallia sp. NCCP-28]|nr:hypothetical protein [Niallia sp. NCCP-28]GKU81175.1 hypothetical protein NCCP28_05710 [Niallia sp. NCCP-28]